MVNMLAWQVFRSPEAHIQMSSWHIDLLVIPVLEDGERIPRNKLSSKTSHI